MNHVSQESLLKFMEAFFIAQRSVILPEDG